LPSLWEEGRDGEGAAREEADGGGGYSGMAMHDAQASIATLQGLKYGEPVAPKAFARMLARGRRKTK
jgi:hypothetical protein